MPWNNSNLNSNLSRWNQPVEDVEGISLCAPIHQNPAAIACYNFLCGVCCRPRTATVRLSIKHNININDHDCLRVDEAPESQITRAENELSLAGSPLRPWSQEARPIGSWKMRSSNLKVATGRSWLLVLAGYFEKIINSTHVLSSVLVHSMPYLHRLNYSFKYNQP